MVESEEPRGALRAFCVAAVALAGLIFSATGVAPRIDDALLDREWRFLRQFAPRLSADDVIIVGIDPATVSAIPEPAALWHASLGLALARISSAKPRAIGLDFPLPERSYEALRPGLDRAFLTGLAAAIDNGPFVATLAIDARTRSARHVHPPFLVLLTDERLGIGLLARDADGVTRRFSLLVPTEDGGFPTFAGRLCRALSRNCADGLIDFSLGPELRYVPLKQVIESRDADWLRRLFRDRIVLIGETQPFVDRIAVPLNLAGWERGGADSPAIVVHAQALRSALDGTAPAEATRAWTIVIAALAALAFLVRDWRLALAVGALAAIGAFAIATAFLHRGLFVPIAPALFTLAVAVCARAAVAWRCRRYRGP